MEQSRRPREARADSPPQPARPARPSPPRGPLVRTHAGSAIGTIIAAKDALAFRDEHCVSSDREAERRRHASAGVRESRTNHHTGPTPGSNAPPRGHRRGHSCTSGSQHPLPPLLPLPRSRHRASRNPLALLRFARILPNRTLRFWAESGAGSDPPFSSGSTAPQSGLMQALLLPVGGRSQLAPAAQTIPAGRLLGTDGTTRVPILVDYLGDSACAPHHLHHHGLRCVPRVLGRSDSPQSILGRASAG